MKAYYVEESVVEAITQTIYKNYLVNFGIAQLWYVDLLILPLDLSLPGPPQLVDGESLRTYAHRQPCHKLPEQVRWVETCVCFCITIIIIIISSNIIIFDIMIMIYHHHHHHHHHHRHHQHHHHHHHHHHHRWLFGNTMVVPIPGWWRHLWDFPSFHRNLQLVTYLVLIRCVLVVWILLSNETLVLEALCSIGCSFLALQLLLSKLATRIKSRNLTRNQ